MLREFRVPEFARFAVLKSIMSGTEPAPLPNLLSQSLALARLTSRAKRGSRLIHSGLAHPLVVG